MAATSRKGKSDSKKLKTEKDLPNFEKESDTCLRKLADRLRATDEYIEEGKGLCEKVRLKLQEQVSKSKQPYSIAATRYAGSVGKRTDVVAPDFDVVLQINQRRPPFHDVLDFFEEKLQENSKQLKILPGSIHQTKIKHGVQFSFTNGMEVDLLPATADMSSKQLRQKLVNLRKKKNYSSKDWIPFSTSFVKEQKDFMKRQTGFAHGVTRLSKHFFKSLHFPDSDGKVTGGSTIFELLGVEAAMHVKGSGGESMLKALTRVMDNVENLDTLQLAFKKGAKGNWLVMSGGDLLPDGKGQVSKLHKDNYIIEPSISVNNILKKMTPETKEQFKAFAGIMKTRLAKLKSGELGVEKVFEPLPVTLQSLSSQPSPGIAYVTQAKPKGEFRLTPATIIRSKDVSPEQMKMASVLTSRLTATVANIGATVCYQPVTKAEQTGRCKIMVGTARDMIKATYPGMMVNEEGKLKGMRMKSFDAVITVPYRSADERCVMVGLGWNPKTVLNIDKTHFC